MRIVQSNYISIRLNVNIYSCLVGSCLSESRDPFRQSHDFMIILECVWTRLFKRLRNKNFKKWSKLQLVPIKKDSAITDSFWNVKNLLYIGTNLANIIFSISQFFALVFNVWRKWRCNSLKKAISDPRISRLDFFSTKSVIFFEDEKWTILKHRVWFMMLWFV